MNKRLLLILCAFTLSFTAMGQGLRDMRINEILVKNVDSYSDDYGHKVSWIELYNSGYSSVNVGGAFLSLTSNGETTTYKIPTNDSRLIVAPQGYVVFFADGSENRGTFYTNFILGDVDSTTIAKAPEYIEKLQLLDQSGKIVMDEIEYDVKTQKVDVTFGRHMNYETGEAENVFLSHVTPKQTNETIPQVKKSETFRKNDPAGIAMAVTAMSVVFSALLLLYIVFRFIGKLNQRKSQAKAEKAAPVAKAANAAAPAKGGLTGEEIAAIAIAINMFEEELHDIESNVITINKVARAYSPWSSKIYGLGQLPNKKTR